MEGRTYLSDHPEAVARMKDLTMVRHHRELQVGGESTARSREDETRNGGVKIAFIIARKKIM